MPTTRIQSAATSGTTKTAKMSAAGTRDDDRAADARANAIMNSTAGIHTANDRDDREGQAADGRGPERTGRAGAPPISATMPAAARTMAKANVGRSPSARRCSS